MVLLTQFLLRLAFGLAAGMALVSPRQVSSGYFRNHLYVTLGLTALAALVSHASDLPAFWPAVAAGALSYVGSVCWLYEKPMAGRSALVLVAAAALWAAHHAQQYRSSPDAHSSLPYLGEASILTSGAVLGVTMAAMLLGHWYLNAPGMKLEPLRRLLAAAAIAVLLHALVCGAGAWMDGAHRPASTAWSLFLALRWSFGLVGVIILIAMAWRTLDVPNTQSATGILYVAVIGTFVGETTSLLLSAESPFPL
jgi:hypothetical protein